MAITGIIHHFGTFLLFAATIFLIITCISAPVVNDIALLKVRLASGSAGTEISFGTFGWCILDATGRGNDICSNSVLGYSPTDIVSESEGTRFDDAAIWTTNALTKVMVLHPIGAGIAFIGFVMALGASVVGSFLASVVAGLSFIITLVVLITDFVMFAIIRDQVNDNDEDGGNNNSYSYYSVAIWTLLAAAICSFLAMIILFFTCCSARMHKRRRVTKGEHYDAPAPAVRTNRRWYSRSRY